MQLIDIIISDGFLEYSVKLVQDFDPSIEIGTGPSPRVNVANEICEVFVWSIVELFYELYNVRLQGKGHSVLPP